MPCIVMIDKTGKVKDINWKDFQEADIYKKAGLKSNKDFKCIRKDCWQLSLNGKSYNISVYGKTRGRAGQENQYDLPPPLDIPSSTVKLPFFSSLVLVNYHTDGVTVQSLMKEEWNAIYETLFGGFEDLSDDSDESEEDTEGLDLDANGYEKDGFVVDSADEDVLVEDYSEEEDEALVSKKKKKKESSKKKTKAKTKTKEEDIVVENFDYDDCDSELGEEEYMT